MSEQKVRRKRRRKHGWLAWPLKGNPVTCIHCHVVKTPEIEDGFCIQKDETKKMETPSITVEQIKKSLERACTPSGKSLIFRPTCGNGFIEMDPKLVLDAFDEIQRKVMFVQTGIDEFTSSEKVLFQLFIEHAKF